MNRRRLLLTALSFFAVGPALAAKLKRISLPTDASETTIEHSVIRGERDTYVLDAKAGQHIELSISSIEDNAVVDLLPPHSEHPLIQETKDWKGTLPKTGAYKIVVGGTRGNATYKLRVALK